MDEGFPMQINFKCIVLILQNLLIIHAVKALYHELYLDGREFGLNAVLVARRVGTPLGFLATCVDQSLLFLLSFQRMSLERVR